MADFTHYNRGLDPEWVEFSKTFKIPEPPKDLTLAKQIFNKKRAEHFQKVLGPIHGVSTQDHSIPAQDGHEIPARLYFPDVSQQGGKHLPLYVYLHGGGYLFGSIETEDMHCRLISVQVPCIVLNVDYRHTPDWKFPTPFEDVFNAVDWITDPSRAKQHGIDLHNVVVGGVSAGATMSIAVAIRDIQQGQQRLKGLNVSLPSTAPRSRFPSHLLKDGYTSFEQNADAPLLPMTRLQFLHGLLKADQDSPYVSSLLLPDTTLKEFPPIAFHVCGADPVRDGALLLEQKLRSLGNQTRMEVYSGWPHAFWNQPQLRKSAEYRERMIDDARWLFSL